MKFKNLRSVKVAKDVVDSCIHNNKKFIFISGNGGSGKTELSKALLKEGEKYGHANLLDADDFVVDTKLRNSAKAIWVDISNTERMGRYTTSLEASYFLQSLKAILFNIENGNDYYHWPKKAVDSKECKLLFGDAILTIVEGVGTVFLDKNNSVSIFLRCNEDVEISRRIGRGQFSNEKSEEEVKAWFAERNSQYKTFVEPHISDYDLLLESRGDFSFDVIRDDDEILATF